MILIVLLTLGFAPMVAGQPWQICGTTGNYTANSTYQYNIESLQHILDPGGSSSLFDQGSRGDVPDEVYTLAFCRSDVNDSACRACVADAFKGARQLCGLSKDATVFYDMCLLSYSNQDILGTDLNNRFNASVVAGPLILMNITTEPMFPGWDTHDRDQAAIIDEVKQLLNETIQQMFTSTRQYYAATRKVTDHGNVTFPALYSMAQCTPDLVEDLCYACLKNFIGLATANFAGRQGGRILGLRCNLRYDTYQFYGGEPTSSSGSLNSVVPSPAPPLPPSPIVVPTQKYKKPMNKVLVIALVAPLLALFICVIVSFRFMRRHIKGKAKMNVHEGEELIWGLEGRSSEFMIYDFSQVLEATGNFSEENKLGQGGFGPVYKGRFPDGLEIAVKRLASHSGQGITEFKNEIQLIAKLQHTNLVRLLGCCYQREEKILIYEYLPNKSLDFFIFDDTRRTLLDWTKRLTIIDGIAQGLLYLHKHSRLRVIHRDLKTSNILLDRELNPKISDFGLAKIFSTNDTEGNTKRIVGTYGYMAPEYASEGLFSIKSDVFSFGVLTLEVVSGKRTSSFHRYGDFINLLGHAWQLWKDERWLQLVDASLVAEGHTLEMMRCINIALLCVQENAADRPTMSEVVAMLSSESMTLPEPKHPAYFHVRVTNEEASTIVVPSSVNNITVSDVDGR